MPLFSAKSNQKLSQAHSDLIIIFNEVIKYEDCTIIESYRDADAQERAVKEGKSKVHFPFGAHNSLPSVAVDVSPYPIRWDDTKRFYVFYGIVRVVVDQLLASGKITHKIRWGGDWGCNDNYNDQKFNDLDHFELLKND